MARPGNEDEAVTPAIPCSLAEAASPNELLRQSSAISAVVDSSPPPPFPIQPRDSRRYALLGEHGRGGIGRVSKVHDRELKRDIAIKELHTRSAENEARFLREVL